MDHKQPKPYPSENSPVLEIPQTANTALSVASSSLLTSSSSETSSAFGEDAARRTNVYPPKPQWEEALGIALIITITIMLLVVIVWFSYKSVSLRGLLVR
jgi:hypothetical protein